MLGSRPLSRTTAFAPRRDLKREKPFHQERPALFVASPKHNPKLPILSISYPSRFLPLSISCPSRFLLLPRRWQAVLEVMMRYLVAHISRLNYRERLATGYAIGTIVVEGAAKTLGLRLKACGARCKHRKRTSHDCIGLTQSEPVMVDFWQNAV